MGGNARQDMSRRKLAFKKSHKQSLPLIGLARRGPCETARSHFRFRPERGAFFAVRAF